MIRLLRAFAWLRWRLFVNSFRGGRRRDALERVSRAAAVIVPLVLALLMVPLALGLGGLAAFLGWRMGRAGVPHPVFLLAARGLLGGLTFAIVLSPIVRSIQNAGTGATRFTLLPIPRRLLHTLEFLAGLTDPWIAVLIPALVLLPCGLLASGAVGAGAVALFAGVLLIASLLAVSSSLSNILQWVYRSRRRGEVVTLIVLAGLSLSGFIPMFLAHTVDSGGRHGRPARHRETSTGSANHPPGGPASGQDAAPPASVRGNEPPAAAAEFDPHPPAATTQPASPPPAATTESAPHPPAAMADSDPHPPAATTQPAAHPLEATGESDPPPSAATGASEPGVPAADAHKGIRSEEIERARRGGDWTILMPRPLGVVARGLPSEMYVLSLAAGIEGRTGGAAIPLIGLLLAGAVLYTASWTAYRRVLETPSGGASGRGLRELRIRTWHLPGLGSAASAVAAAHIRSLLRTVQGKMLVFFSPLALTIVGIGLTRMHGRELDLLHLKIGGSPIVGFGAVISLLSLQKVMLNQFAIDRAGFTLQLLAPISDRDLVKGKAAGTGVLYLMLLTFFLIAAAVLAPGGQVLMWASPLLGAIAAYVVFAPIAAFLSALFPKSADLNRMGSGGNPSGLASLFGMLVTGLVTAPPVILSVGALLLAKSPALAFGLVALWTVIAAALSIPLTRLAARTLAARRENIALVAQGR